MEDEGNFWQNRGIEIWRTLFAVILRPTFFLGKLVLHLNMWKCNNGSFINSKDKSTVKRREKKTISCERHANQTFLNIFNRNTYSAFFPFRPYNIAEILSGLRKLKIYVKLNDGSDFYLEVKPNFCHFWHPLYFFLIHVDHQRIQGDPKVRVTSSSSAYCLADRS